MPRADHDDHEASAGATRETFPFGLVVLSFPDAAAAVAAGPDLADLLDPWLPCPWAATADPAGRRVGSGGAALDAIRSHLRGPSLTPPSRGDHHDRGGQGGEGGEGSILLILAGGESSRAPTQMVLGKAWTSLPSVHPDFAPPSPRVAEAATEAAAAAHEASEGGRRHSPLASSAAAAQAAGSPPAVAVTTPLLVGIRLLARALEGLPRGSVVVMAGDTILNLPADSAPTWRELCERCRRTGGPDVVGVAVPAPIETARNHGVYVPLDRGAAEPPDSEPFAGGLFPCSQVWQKPPIERLRDAFPEGPGGRREAWIDTGVVIFLPHVVPALLGLANLYFAPLGPSAPGNRAAALPKLDLYTHILQAFRTTATGAPSGGAPESDEGGARDRYCDSLYGGGPEGGRELGRAVWDALSRFDLSVWCLPGDFLHLGTSRELARFLSVAAGSPPTAAAAAAPEAGPARFPCQNPGNNRGDAQGIGDGDLELLDPGGLVRRVGRSLGLVRRCDAHFSAGVEWDDPESTVACHVLLRNGAAAGRAARLEVGSRTVLEHCWVEVPGNYCHATARIGSDCLVSGLRYVGASYALKVPDGMIVQMVSLPANNAEADMSAPQQIPESPETVLIVLGMDDPIKSRGTVFGRPFHAFLDYCQLSERDIWDEGLPPASRSLWNARIHAVIDTTETTATIFDWLGEFLERSLEGGIDQSSVTASHRESLAAWKASKRLSLAEVRDSAGTAAAEFEYRRRLAAKLDAERDEYFRRVGRLLTERVLEPLDWRWIVDEYAATNSAQRVLDMARALDGVIQESLLGGAGGPQLDVCGRACRVTGAFLRDLCDACVRRGGDVCEESQSQVSGLSSISTDSLDTLRVFLKTCSHKRDNCLLESPLKAFREALRVMDAVAQLMTERCVFGFSPTTMVIHGNNSPRRPVINRWVVATAPARIDVAGGWTDTPPICFEYGSFVTGLAVLVDGLKPLSCSCRILPGSSGIRLRTESRDGRTGELRSRPVEVRIMNRAGLEDFRDPTSDCALLKCALVLLGLVQPLNHKKRSPDDEPELQELINAFCRVGETVGIEIVASSSLPHGSGLGTSSILGGCIIASIQKCLGYDVVTSDERMNDLVDAVLRLEQLLTTGGGFQDQVNGLIGGAKAVSCDPSVFPLTLRIERLDLGRDAVKSLDERLMLAFTGKTRLAKNLLQNVLRRWSAQTTEIHDVVESLASGAKRSREALLRNDVDAIGECLMSYWEQKKSMAGLESGVEPPSVKEIIDALSSHRAISGASLCGAGGGGFLVLLRSQEATEEDVRRIVADCVPDSDVTWHQCALSDTGLHVEVLDQVNQEP